MARPWALTELMTKPVAATITFGTYSSAPGDSYSSQPRQGLFPDGEEIKPGHYVGWN